MRTKSFLFNLMILSFFLIAGGILSANLKYELLYDLLQYHYYNGFAFLNGRLLTDLAPAAVPTYYNPLLDAAVYALIQTFKNDINVYYFIMGLPFGMLMFVFFKITLLFFDPQTAKGKICIGVCLLIAATGFNVWFQIGTATHEIPVAVLILGAVYVLLKKPVAPKAALLAGILLGMAAGFKLTAAIYCVSTGLTLILFYRSLEKPKTTILSLAAGGLAGFLTVNGFWMITLWQNFQNPFFPFWNAIFKSPYYLNTNYVDRLHLQNLTPFIRIFMPFYLVFHPYNSNIGVMADLCDARFAIVFLIAVYFAAVFFTKKRIILSEQMRFYGLWLFVSYLVWIMVSANLRFTIPIETGFAVLLTAVGASFKKPAGPVKESLYFSALIFIAGVLVTTPYLSYHWSKRESLSLLEEKIVLPENTLLITLGLPSSGFAAEIAQNNPGMRLLSFTTTDGWKAWNIAGYEKMRKKADDLLKNSPGKAALVVVDVFEPTETEFPELGLIRGWDCRPVKIQYNVFRLFVGSKIKVPELCVPPKEKI